MNTEVGKVFCSSSEKLCANGEQCIASVKWCDGIINCIDRSDELSCPCKERINAGKLCDGYFDCPDGADERGCFGKFSQIHQNGHLECVNH